MRKTTQYGRPKRETDSCHHCGSFGKPRPLRGSVVRECENCAARWSDPRLALALERQGIDVCMMDMLSSVARVTNPFELPVRQSRRMVMTGQSTGGTPLSDALSVAADRVRWKRGETFVVVITDGEPDSEEAYADTLDDIGAFAGSTIGMALVGIFGLAFCWYGVGMVRSDSRALA